MLKILFSPAENKKSVVKREKKSSLVPIMQERVSLVSMTILLKAEMKMR